MYKMTIYRVIEGSDDWPVVDIITGDTWVECIHKAERLYNQDEYHWTTPTKEDGGYYQPQKGG